LLRQAYVEGRITPGGNTFDPAWWQKLEWTLYHVESLNCNKVSELRHSMHCHLLDYRNTVKQMDTHWDQALVAETAIEKNLLPWKESDTRRTRRRAVQELYRLWVKQWGDPADPKVAERIAKTVAFLKNPAPAKPKRRGLGRRL
jgi:hypothetical protein